MTQLASLKLRSEMAISPSFPLNPFEIPEPNSRWYPGVEVEENEKSSLIPPLVYKIREAVHQWRKAGYPGISPTSRSLLRFWFQTPHLVQTDGGLQEFRYYFAQREAVETVIWLYECESARSAADLVRYSSNQSVSVNMFEESWTRYVMKMATGSGKTKVLSLLIAWSYFHHRYEPDSGLSPNVLLIAPNIIVLDRLKLDFEGLRVFFTDPVLPEDGWEGKAWRTDFSPLVHLQDEVGPLSSQGNIFLTNIHRVFEGGERGDSLPDDLRELFLGQAPPQVTNRRSVDLAKTLGTLESLVVMNDEAHHIHDSSLAWFRAIERLDGVLRRKNRGRGISVQLDVTATPKKSNGAIFVQTVSSYPLVEAIRQGVVKTPVLPDLASRSQLQENPTSNFGERFADHIRLGVLEWKKYAETFSAYSKKPVLFIMTTTTEEADEAAEYLEQQFPDFHNRTLVIHTKRNGEINEKAMNPSELAFLRKASREIDSESNPYLAVVSVLMLREGWDVKNVVSMVGLRPYVSDSKILPEQTLGRGLRLMFSGSEGVREYVSVIGTPEFLNFVEEIQFEGVELDYVPMGRGTDYRGPLVVEVDKSNKSKSPARLDIELPVLSRRFSRDTKNLSELDVTTFAGPFATRREYSASELREIRFWDIDSNEPVWTTDLNSDVVPTSQAVLGFLADQVGRKLRLVGGRDILYGKLKKFVALQLFGKKVHLDDVSVLRNLSEVDTQRILVDFFSEAINLLTVTESGQTRVVTSLKVSEAKPSVVTNQDFVLSEKTLFNRVVGDSDLELRFAKLLDKCHDVVSFAKNSPALGFKIEYVNSQGYIANYLPDFIVKVDDFNVYIVETKGLEDLDVEPKWKRLVDWCELATETDANGRVFHPLFVPYDEFNRLVAKADSFKSFVEMFRGANPRVHKG